MTTHTAHETLSTRELALKGSLLAVWFVVSFGCCFFARDLAWSVAGWPVNYWIASQGAVLVFIAILALYAGVRNRMDEPSEPEAGERPDA
jgi:putative solute:sodium symporter small subunit